jgi:hypothetical protein
MVFEQLRCFVGVTRDAAGRPMYRDGSLANLFSCFGCLSVGVAILATLSVLLVPWFVWLHVSLGASWLANRMNHEL